MRIANTEMNVGGEQRTGGKETAPGGPVALTVPSHPRYLYIIRSALYPLVIEAGFGKREARRIVLAVDEACSNIIKYAYEGDPGQTIRMTVEDGTNTFIVRLQDRGKTVDPRTIVPRDLADVKPGGLGSHYMKAIFDTVEYDPAGGGGTLLTLTKMKQVRA